MSIQEEHIEAMYKEEEFSSGGGKYTDPWHIEWYDEPFSPRDETILSPMKTASRLKDTWEHGTPSERTAVYIHIPFCRLACTYCAFFKKQADEKEQHAYAELLCKEILSLRNRPYVEKSNVESIFWGGGTPGILSPEDISAILKALHETFPISEKAEITMESSLSDMTDEKMDAAIAGGVNRFSFGVQSFQSSIRHAIGRPLPREEAMEKLSHFSQKKALMILDLIYGLPGETEETMRQDILDAKSAGAAGLDLYKLQLLPGSPLGKAFQKAGKTLDRDELQRLFQKAEETLIVTGAENISCTHWRWNPNERSLYNTLASDGSDILPIGMACGGKLNGIGIMKPMMDMMYKGAVRLGKFAPMGAKSQSPYRRIYQAVEAAGDKGRINPEALEKQLSLPMGALLCPLLEKWLAWGLVEKAGKEYVYTSAGRYWYRTLLRRMLHGVDYMLFGKPDAKAKAQWGSMVNMK